MAPRLCSNGFKLNIHLFRGGDGVARGLDMNTAGVAWGLDSTRPVCATGTVFNMAAIVVDS